jgi:flagellar hook-associated protein 3 FlgL
VRVTNEQMLGNTLRRLSSRLGQYERAQSQLASGRRILTPSDDPGGTVRALSLRADERSREQEARNAGDAHSRLQIVDAQLSAASERLQRVNELAVRSASTTNERERAAVKAEVLAIREELRGIANTRYRGAPLFAGMADPTEVVAADGTYQGDAGAIERRIGEGETVRVNVTADEAFGLGAGGSPNVFAVLDQFAAQLDAGDTAGVAATIGDLEQVRGTLGRSQSVVGAAANRVESAARRAGDTLLNLRAERAEVEDVDIAEAIMTLQTQQVAYEATLSAMSRALPQSLVNFLR